MKHIESELFKILDPQFPPTTRSDDLIQLAKEHAKTILQDEDINIDSIAAKNPLVIAKNANSGLFLGRPSLQELSEYSLRGLVKNPSYMRQDYAPVTSLLTLDEEPDIEGADYCGFIYTSQIPHGEDGNSPEQTLINEFVDPDVLPDIKKSPAILPFNRAFSGVWKNTLHPEADAELFQQTTPLEVQSPIIWDLVTNGAETFIQETSDQYVQQTGSRFLSLFKKGFIGISLSTNPRLFLTENNIADDQIKILMPVEGGVGFLPNNHFGSSQVGLDGLPQTVGEIVVTPEWVVATEKYGTQSLAHLLHAASLARDHSYRKLNGSQYVAMKGIGVGEISYSLLAQYRAYDLTHRFLNEAYAYDKQFGITPRMDTFCHERMRFSNGANHYDNPNDPTTNNINIPKL